MQIASKRSASGFVNPGGICCRTTIGTWVSLGKRGRMDCNAEGPPVEHPIINKSAAPVFVLINLPTCSKYCQEFRTLFQNQFSVWFLSSTLSCFLSNGFQPIQKLSYYFRFHVFFQQRILQIKSAAPNSKAWKVVSGSCPFGCSTL